MFQPSPSHPQAVPDACLPSPAAPCHTAVAQSGHCRLGSNHRNLNAPKRTASRNFAAGTLSNSSEFWNESGMPESGCPTSLFTRIRTRQRRSYPHETSLNHNVQLPFHCILDPARSADRCLTKWIHLQLQLFVQRFTNDRSKEIPRTEEPHDF